MLTETRMSNQTFQPLFSPDFFSEENLLSKLWRARFAARFCPLNICQKNGAPKICSLQWTPALSQKDP